MNRPPGATRHVLASRVLTVLLALAMVVGATLSMSMALSAQPGGEPEEQIEATQPVERDEALTEKTAEPTAAPPEDSPSTPTETPLIPTQPAPTQLPSQSTETPADDDANDSGGAARASMQLTSAITLTANGEPGPIVVSVGTSVDLVATGLVPGATMTLTSSFGDCAGPERSSVNQPAPDSGTFATTVDLDFPVTLGYQVESEGVTSNCVIVTWGDVDAPVLTVNGSSATEIQVSVGASADVEVRNLTPGAPVSVGRGEFTCYNNPTQIAAGTARGDGTFATTLTPDEPGPIYLGATSDNGNANCVIVQAVATPPTDEIILTANGEANLLIVDVGTPVLLEATGIPPGTAATLRTYPRSEIPCAGTPVGTQPMPEVSPGVFQFSYDSELFATIPFQVVTEAQVSNCVVVSWSTRGAPWLTGNGSLGPLTVPIGTTIELVGQHLPLNTSLFITREAGRCGAGGSTEVFRGQADPDGTISTSVIIDQVGVFAFRLLTSAPSSSNCLIVEGVLPPIDLSANGTTGPVTVDSGESVALEATGLQPGESMTITTRAGSCDGEVMNTETRPVPASGTYEETVDSAISATLAYVVTSAGVTSNCVVVTWITTPVLTVNGSAGPVSALVGETVLVEVSGADPDASVEILRSATGCGTETEMIGSGTADVDGALTVPAEVDRLGPVFVQAVANGVPSNCVEVRGAQAAFTLTANGQTDAVTVVAGAAVVLEASGIVAGSPATLHTYSVAGTGNADMVVLQADSCAGDPLTSDALTVAADGKASWERAEPNAVTLAYQVEANDVRSNCVEVSWLAPPTVAPTEGPTMVPTEIPTKDQDLDPPGTPSTEPSPAQPTAAAAKAIHPETPSAVTALPSTGSSPSDDNRWMLPLFWSVALSLAAATLIMRGSQQRDSS